MAYSMGSYVATMMGEDGNMARKVAIGVETAARRIVAHCC